jgi:iron complex outermembrane receptor protein
VGKFGLFAWFIMLCPVPVVVFAGEPDSEQLDNESGIEVVVVTGVRTREELALETSQVTHSGLDNSDLLRLFPGGNRNSNGPLTRISQYRGLFGAQNNVSIDGLAYTAGGPNWMDSPLSSIPQSLTQSVTLYRGLGSVNVIEEGLGGGISITSRHGEFSSSAEWSSYGVAEAGYGGNAASTGAAAFAGLRNEDNWLDLSVSLDRGDDYEFAGGEVAATEYERKQYRFGYGHRFTSAAISLGAVINRTGDSGTPALPMDIRFVDSEQYSFELETPAGDGELNFRINTLSVEHLMDNFTLRPPPSNSMGLKMFRQTVAVGDSGGFKLAYNLDLSGYGLQLGVDGRQEEHGADITNPQSGKFYITNFNDVQRDRLGMFIQSTGTAGAWDLETGLRYNRVAMNAGEVGGNLAIMTQNPQQGRLDELADAFNEAKRKKKDNQWSGMLKASRDVSGTTRLNLGLGRKVRSPSYQERYLWLPMEATAGLADGWTYIGDIDLKPETSIEANAGLEWSTGTFQLMPELFYRDISNYIQGIPSINLTANMFAMMMNGKRPLQFANVDAEMYGIDMGYEWKISAAWQLRGNIGYVRGKRTDISDNLYRIAPLSSFLELMYVHERIFISMENVAASRQEKVAEYNSEQETAGWGIINLRTGMKLGDIFRLGLGVENLFNKAYQDHLGGYNRVIGSDVPLGERLYSKGRNFYLSFNAVW